METVAALGEFGLIERLDRLVGEAGARPPGIELGIGDDAALLRPKPGADLAVTCDVLLEGRHYLPGLLQAEELGRRVMAVNLSDIAAMGATPRYAFVALGLRAETPVAEVEAWYRGFVEALAPWQAGVAGGNMTRVEGPQFLAVTLMGEVGQNQALRRQGARPGDAVLVSGCPGQAAAGLHLLRLDPGRRASPLAQAYLAPRARVDEARTLAAAGLVSAAIDLSDGLLGDLGHLCTASRVGARLWADRLPQTPLLREAAVAAGRDPLEWVLGPSDDYELILTCAPDKVAQAQACVAALGQVALHQIGEVTPHPGQLVLVDPAGRERVIAKRGWDHFGL